MIYPNATQTPYLPHHWEGFTKKELADKADAAVAHVLETGAPLRMAETLSAMEAFIKLIKGDERFNEYVREELAKNSGKELTASGAKIEACEAGVTYDYTVCNDEHLRLLEIAAQREATEVAERKDFLKTLPKAGLEILTRDGELVTLYPPSKTSKSTYKVTLKSK